jgi:hypothetical protein
VANSITTLRSALPNSPIAKSAVEKLKAELVNLKHRIPPSVGHLMGIEGRVGYAYFNAWRRHPLNWSNTGRRPIPDDWRWIGQLLSGGEWIVEPAAGHIRSGRFFHRLRAK